MSVVRKRSIHLHGRKTSISLEDEFWSALREIAALRKQRIPDLINVIADQRPQGLNLSSAMRLYVLRHIKQWKAREGSGTMADENTVPFVEKAVDDLRQRIGEKFTPEAQEWFASVLNTFAAELVSRVVPETEPCRSEVLERARSAGVDIDAVIAPTMR